MAQSEHLNLKRRTGHESNPAPLPKWPVSLKPELGNRRRSTLNVSTGSEFTRTTGENPTYEIVIFGVQERKLTQFILFAVYMPVAVVVTWAFNRLVKRRSNRDKQEHENRHQIGKVNSPDSR